LHIDLTGNASSPGIDVALVLVGRERMLARIGGALAYVDRVCAMGDNG
jgi:hypothetical protein